MTFLPDSRTGIRREISGFVVHEEQSLEARLRRSYQAARAKTQEAVGQARGRVAQIGKDTSGSPEAPARVERGPSLFQTCVERGQGIVRDALSSGQRQWRRIDDVVHSTLVRLQPADRLKDVASLLWIALRFMVRVFWHLPIMGKMIVLTMAMIGLVLTWPGETTDAPPPVELPPSLRTGEAALPPKFNPDLWKPVAAPIAAFHLEAPELDRSLMRYRARTHADGARQDMLFWEQQAGAETARRRVPVVGAVVIEQYPKGQPAPDSFFLESARRAALLATSVERMGESIGLQTKFGVFETADATLLSEQGRRQCLAFRHAAEAVSLHVSGWFCGTSDKPVDRSALGCMLDRIDILSAGKDQALRSYFAGVERARRACGAARLVSAKPQWTDPEGAMPALKASILPVAAR